eukprot:scaffold1029_cov364-Pinguiococcus_pyrenoidosus.AAC.3
MQDQEAANMRKLFLVGLASLTEHDTASIKQRARKISIVPSSATAPMANLLSGCTALHAFAMRSTHAQERTGVQKDVDSAGRGGRWPEQCEKQRRMEEDGEEHGFFHMHIYLPITCSPAEHTRRDAFALMSERKHQCPAMHDFACPSC